MRKTKKINKYEASDCLQIFNEKKEILTDPNDEFLMNIMNSSKSVSCFTFDKSNKEKEAEPVVYYDYYSREWKAGRYIGNVEWQNGKTQYSISISPRFGKGILMDMFAEIFNLKFTQGCSEFGGSSSFYIKILICYIWQQKLSSSIRHGLPRKKESKINRGYEVKGHLLVKPSVFSYNKNKTIISKSFEQTYDKTIIAIINQAYKILKNDYAFDDFSKILPRNSTKAIRNIENIAHSFDRTNVTEKDYQSISYHPIYQAYKDLVDFSWQIIKLKTGAQIKTSSLNVSGFLIDMAEVWECYLRSIIERRLSLSGWKLINSTFTVYNKMFYKRKIIPDIVLEKDGNFCVFDAKYKKMEYRGIDVDREDFFQIHTYISYMQSRGHVLVSGLLYPVESESKDVKTDSLLFENDSTCRFIVDGPYINNDNNSENIVNADFLAKLESIVKEMEKRYNGF